MSRHDEALKKLHLGGVIPAIPLALDENRQYNEKGQRLLTRYYLESGADGIAIAVHTTQFEIRDKDINLLEPVLKTVSEEIERYENETGRVIIKVSGVCGKIESAVKEAELAKRYGYDACLLSPGGLSDCTEDYLVERTKQVAAVMPVIAFYLQTAVGGRIFSFDYWSRICATENVVAIKCASFNRYTTVDVARAAAFSERSGEIALYTGNDDNIVIDLLTAYRFTKDGKTYEQRFRGGLLGHWSVWTNTVVKQFTMIKAAAGKDTIPSELLTLAAEITDANAALFDTAHGFLGCIAGLHEVLRRQGLMDGIWCLNPNETLSPGQSEEINRVYALYPHLNDDEFIKENLPRWKQAIGM